MDICADDQIFGGLFSDKGINLCFFFVYRTLLCKFAAEKKVIKEKTLEKDNFDYAQSGAFAAQYGLIVGGLWITSFLCTMYSAEQVMLGFAGNLCAVLSLFAEVKLLNYFSREIAPLEGMRKWMMAWRIAIYAALLTGLAQYIYFKFFDDGRILNAMRQAAENPESRQAWESILNGADLDVMLEEMSMLSVGDMTMSCMIFNIFAALAFSILSTWLSKPKKKKN